MQREFSDLDSLVDHGHSFLKEVEHAPHASGYERALGHARLVVHEWLANLVQYADFGVGEPQISIQVRLGRTGLHFAIADNSAGFDFHAGVRAQRTALAALPHRGLGLLMIAACTEDLTYERRGARCHRLFFTVPMDADPELEIPFCEE